jgi:SAM-dependent methyltransferase
MSETAGGRYVMGHNERERRRLALQAAITNPLTEQLLTRAGIAPGMNVVDFGCGVGDVTLIAARLVGRHGRVTAVDIDPEALATVEGRSRDLAISNVTPVRAAVDEYAPDRAVDAVVGRHILIHSPDPLRVLRSARRMLRAGGVAAFQESDFSTFAPTYPPCPLMDRLCGAYGEFFARATHGNIGARLFHLLQKAGFQGPQCRGEFLIDGGEDSPYFEWAAETFRSILPKAAAMGIGTEFVPIIDTLADQLRAEAVALGAACVGPLMVGGFARKR